MNVYLEIQTNSAGDPSGTKVENADAIINFNDIVISPSWIQFIFSTAPSLTAAVQYHIVVECELLYTGFKTVVWRHNSAGGYTDGMLKVSTDAGSNWADQSDEDAAFKTYKGSTADQTADIDIDYYKTYL